jgi:ABC-type uncharacterized transport system substrate-binding protein
MGVSTFLVAFLPGYATIGLWGAVLLTILRLLQGIGVGGEWGGSVLLSMEWARHNHERGFLSSWPQFGGPAGLFLANLAVLVFSWISGDAFLSWGWRIPFAFSIVLVGIGLWIRLRIPETPVFRNLVAERRIERAPIIEVCRKQWGTIILTALARTSEQAQRKPKVILVSTIPAGRIAQQIAPTIPLVMTGLIDPVGAGLIASLARPGNNTTGISNMAQDMTAKSLELLRSVVPTIRTVAVLFNPANPGNHLILDDVRNKAATLSATVRPIEFRGFDTLDTTIEAATGNDALLMIGDAALIDLREPIATLALRHRLPTASSIPEFTDVGALIGYGPSRRALYKRAATYVKKLLDGAKPSDLPVEQPTEIELSINMRTAKALGLVFPDTLIARADRVVE